RGRREKRIRLWRAGHSYLRMRSCLASPEGWQKFATRQRRSLGRTSRCSCTVMEEPVRNLLPAGSMSIRPIGTGSLSRSTAQPFLDYCSRANYLATKGELLQTLKPPSLEG